MTDRDEMRERILLDADRFCGGRDNLTPEQWTKMEAAIEAAFSEEVARDVFQYGGVFADIDGSIRLHTKLHIQQPWDEWEWPRRLAYHHFNR